MAITFSEKQRQTIIAPYRHFEVNEGTPRSGKTTASTFRFARHLIECNDESHLIVAYNQEQAYKLIIEGDGLGLLHIFDGCCRLKNDRNGDHLEVTTPKGIRRVYYKGGGKADSHKSITGLSIGSVYFCEIDLLHMNMIQECLRRTFAARDRWHIADLNPPSPHHPVIKEVFDVQKAAWQHWRIDDNPIITEERKHEIEEQLKASPFLYKRDWLGERTMPQGVIYAMFDHAKHIASKMEGAPIEMYFSGDGGQGDATTLICNIVTRDGRGFYRLYNAAMYYHSGNETGEVKAMSQYARELQTFVNYCERTYKLTPSTILIDPACKSLREECNAIGLMTDKADNNGSEKIGAARGIEVGIERLQSLISDGHFFVVECANEQYLQIPFYKEIELYCRDTNGKPVDMYNHAMDAQRYGANYFYKYYIA